MPLFDRQRYIYVPFRSTGAVEAVQGVGQCSGTEPFVALRHTGLDHVGVLRRVRSMAAYRWTALTFLTACVAGCAGDKKRDTEGMPDPGLTATGPADPTAPPSSVGMSPSSPSGSTAAAPDTTPPMTSNSTSGATDGSGGSGQAPLASGMPPMQTPGEAPGAQLPGDPDDAVEPSTSAPSDAGLSGAPDPAQPGAADAAVTPSVDPVDVGCDATSPPQLGALGLRAVLSSSQLDGVSYARQPPDSDDWYLVEQGGRIMVFSDGNLRSTPFFDISAEISVDPTYDERGLHAIEFAPDYATSGLFYIVMTASAGERQNHDLVLEYRRSDTDPNVAEMTPVKTLLDLEGISPNSLFANIHNAYLAKFGPDGFLYVGMGDGGGSCNDNAGFVNLPQDLSSPIGKMLRFDPSAPEPYAAAGNPFVDDGGDPRVYHYGLRNPFRFAWDALTGELYIGDVGQDTHEEISVAPTGASGLNFGWATWEGNQMVCNDRPLNAGSEVIAPIFSTDHGQGNGQFGAGCSASAFCDYSAIVGGSVYRGRGVPELQGAYVFGDWVGDNMAAIYHCDGQVSDVTSIDYVPDPNYPNNGYFVKVGDGVPELASISAIVEDHDHELYLVANGDSLLQIVSAP